MCLTGFGITETFRRRTEECARQDKKNKPSRTAAPPPFTFVSGGTASGLPEGLAAPGLRMFSYPDTSIPCWAWRKQRTLKKKERGRKENLPCCLERKHSWNASQGGTYLTYSVNHRQSKLSIGRARGSRGRPGASRWFPRAQLPAVSGRPGDRTVPQSVQRSTVPLQAGSAPSPNVPAWGNVILCC